MWDTSFSMWYSQLTSRSSSCEAHEPSEDLPSHSYQIEHGTSPRCAAPCPLIAMRGCCLRGRIHACAWLLVFDCFMFVVVVRFVAALFIPGQIGMRLVINIICLWNLGRASKVTWQIVMCVVKLGWDFSLISFACGIWAAPPAKPEELWMFVVELGWDLSLISFACGIWAAPLAQPEELRMFMVKFGWDLSALPHGSG